MQNFSSPTSSSVPTLGSRTYCMLESKHSSVAFDISAENISCDAFFPQPHVENVSTLVYKLD